MIKVNDVELNVTYFPDGTSQVWKLENFEGLKEADSIVIKWDFQNESEIFHIMQLSKLLRGTLSGQRTVMLKMPFLPYGRQDKIVSNETTFSLQVFADLINMCKFDSVVTIDAHNADACYRFFYNFCNIEPTKEIRFAENAISNYETDAYNTFIAYPDAGADTRYNKNKDNPYILGHKVRDQETGWIKEYKITGNPKGRDILMVDDICDGGMTFKLMSESLLKEGAQSVHLYVTHGIFSKGIDTLRESGIHRIFTKNGEIL